MANDITVEQLDSFLLEIKNEYAVALSKSEKEASEKSEKSSSEKKAEASAPEKPDGEKTGLEHTGVELKKDDMVAKPKPEGEAPEAPAEAAPEEAAPEAPPEEAAPQEDPAADGAMGADQIYDMYCKLDEEQLALHFMACSKALYSKMDQEEEVPPEGMPPQDPAEAAPPAAPPEAPAGTFGKSEKLELEKLNKSLQDKTSELEKKVEQLTETLTKVVNHPSRKAFTASNFSSVSKEVKSEQVLSKSEIIAKLCEKAKSPNLSEADQSKIYQYSIKPVFTEELKKFLTEEVK